MKTSSKTQTQGLWKNHSEAWKVSGLTQQAYCEQEGISYRSFVYQHSRLVSDLKKAPLNFVEAKPETVVHGGHACTVHLMLPNGIRIGIGAEINPVLLQTVLSVAGAIQCLS